NVTVWYVCTWPCSVSFWFCQIATWSAPDRCDQTGPLFGGPRCWFCFMELKVFCCCIVIHLLCRDWDSVRSALRHRMWMGFALTMRIFSLSSMRTPHAEQTQGSVMWSPWIFIGAAS